MLNIRVGSIGTIKPDSGWANDWPGKKVKIIRYVCDTDFAVIRLDTHEISGGVDINDIEINSVVTMLRRLKNG